MEGRHSLLERYFDRLEAITGLRVCIYDLGYFTLEDARLDLPYARRVHCSAYCELVKSDPEAHRCCVETESWRIEQAAAQAKPFVHRCHAGVTDLVVPIRVGTRLVGAIFLGQSAPTGANAEKVARRIAARYPSLNAKGLREAMAGLPRADEARLRELADMIRFAADYVRQALGSTITETTTEAQICHDARGRLRMERVPNYFLGQLSTGDGAMRRALTHVRENYWRELLLPDVAAKAGLSVSHFSRLFHRTFGMPFRRCLVEARLSAAGWLTKKTDLKIKEVAELVGYGDVSSLPRALRIHAGVTPRSLRSRQPMPWHMNQPKLMPQLDKADTR